MSFLDELEEVEKEKERFSSFEIIYLTIVIAVGVSLLSRIYFLYSDDALIAYKAPEVTEMGAPIKLTRVTELPSDRLHNMLHDFTRQYIRALYPKNSLELEHHYNFIIKHTRNKKLLNEYLGYLEDKEAIGSELDLGKVTWFSPVNSLDLRIRKKQNQKAWIVEIDGFLNNSISSLKDDRGIVTLRFQMTYDRPSSEGSYSGWYVTDYEIITTTDPIANNQKNVKTN